MSYIIHERSDGRLSITPVDHKFNGDPWQHWSTEGVRANYGEPTAIHVVSTEIPWHQKRFHAAWRFTGKQVAVDMEVLRGIRMSEIRKERNVKLDALDKEYVKGLSTKQDVTALEVKMQALRDIPQTTDLSKIETPEALEAFNPAWPE